MKAALTIGNFDGVHRGHQELIQSLVSWRRKHPNPEQIKTIALTFDPHPREILNPNNKIQKICSLKERIQLLERMGIDEVRVIEFSQMYSQMSAPEFFHDILLQNLKAEFIAVGSNFFFGKNREGSPEKIVQWCDESKIECQLLPPITADGSIVSSSRIRELIRRGNLIPASRLLGRQYSISGIVEHGNKRGRSIGFPTANVQPQAIGNETLCLPPNGVYLSSVTIANGGGTYPSISNIGYRPTVVDESPLVLETHLLDYEGDLYGKFISVEFRDSIRSEMKFPSISELIQQIQRDISLARQKLKAK